MIMKEYILRAQSNSFIKTYKVSAESLEDACYKAKVKFAKDFNVFGKNVKVGLDSRDVENHIEEIMEKIYKGS